MDLGLIYAKTPSGDEAVRQTTRVVQRNLRMVLVQVDGKLTVEELSIKIGNPLLVEKALRELEDGGFIAPTLEAASIWEESRRQVKKDVQVSALSQFSTFGAKSIKSESEPPASAPSSFSTFSKPASSSGEGRAANIEDDQHAAVQREIREIGYPSLKAVLLGLLAVVVLALAAVFFYPYDRSKPDLERALAEVLNAPVKIGQVNLALLPQPHLRLEQVQIGVAGESRVGLISVYSPMSLLGGSPHRISLVRISQARISANLLVALPMFQGGIQAPHGPLIQQLKIDDLQIDAGSVALQGIVGEIAFKPDGMVEKTTFETVDRSIRGEAMPTAQGIRLSFEGLGWQLPGGKLTFESLQAKGLLQKDRLLVDNLDSTLMGGIIKGNGMIDWSNGISLVGEYNVSRLDCRQVSKAFAPALDLEGDLSGVFRLRASGSTWEHALEHMEATLDADITRGNLVGVDLGEAARRGAGSTVRGGATKFDALHVALNIRDHQVIGRDIDMDAGMVRGAGQFSANAEAGVEVRLTVTMQTSVSTLRVPVRLSGHLPNLEARAEK